MPVIFESKNSELDLYLNWNAYSLFHYHKECDNFSDCLEEVYKHRRGATFAERYATEYAMSLKGVFNHGKHLHTIFNLGTIAIAFPSSKGHPLLERFTVLLPRFLERGLPDQYSLNLIRYNVLKNLPSNNS